MNTKNLKAYAPKARAQFIEAIKKRAAQFGLYQDKIADVQFEGGAAIIEGRAFTKKQGEQRKRLEQKIAEKPLATHKERYDLFIREMAYTWFNRLAAIRYMELHDYLDHGFRVLSPVPSKTIDVQGSTPEILDNAADVADSLALDKNHIIELQLAGDKEEELYRELLLGQCHHLYKIMPFMFEAIDDAAELLLPNNLTKTDSILKGLVNDIPEQDWSEIEVIGWLYQFYISEHKDAVIGKVIKSEDIPAATQLFTPNWIVKYLVQNSLGRQWLATYPESELKGKMEYHIEPADQTEEVNVALAAITPSSIDPETIKILDPAAGSGHILVEVYEVLREIYLERGYRLREIPELILTKNIYGLDIDDRAAQLAGFALMMKAREDDRRIFERLSQRVEDGQVTLNVYSLQSTEGLDIDQLWQALNLEGNQKQGSTGGLFDGLEDEPAAVIPSTSPVIPAKAGIYAEYFELLQALKSAFLQAKTLGSLIQIDHKQLETLEALTALCQEKAQSSDPSAKIAANTLLPILSQAILLAQQYDVVVANPPYMGAKGMNSALKGFLKISYPKYKTDLFSAFIASSNASLKGYGYSGLMTPFVWMYLKSYLPLRQLILRENALSTLIQPEYHSFFESAYVPIIGFCYQKSELNWKGTYFDLKDFYGADEQPKALLNAINTFSSAYKYQIFQEDFHLMPDSPIAFSLSSSVRNCFKILPKLSDSASPKQGLATGCNDLFLRQWFEVSVKATKFDCCDIEDTKNFSEKWFPYNKGGEFRKWYGNQDYVVNWEMNGKEIRKFGIKEKGKPRSRAQNTSSYFKPAVSWSKITVGEFSTRFFEKGFAFDVAGCSIFSNSTDELKIILALLNSNLTKPFIKSLAQTINYEVGQIGAFPITEFDNEKKIRLVKLVDKAIKLAKSDWDSNELSWGFKKFKFMNSNHTESGKIISGYDLFIEQAKSEINKLKLLEDEINYIVVEQYQMQEEVSRIVDFSKITHRFSKYLEWDKNENRIELRGSINKYITEQFLSHSLGCIMGRYSLDREGLVYAHAGNEGFKELVAEGAYQTFPADDDGIVPLASEEWLFEDDATTRFREFVLTVWGEEHLQENLEFVAQSLCLHSLKPLSNKGQGESAMDTIRRYFSTKFFKDHCKTYKKRPIYWLFSSGKEKAFECLVYLHRYNEGTLSRMRTEYVTPLMGKYEHMLNHLADKLADASSAEKRNIEKEQKSLTKKQAELRSFDEQLKHYAEMRITLDLDDGVKANYGKFGNLLADVKAIHGKAVK